MALGPAAAWGLVGLLAAGCQSRQRLVGADLEGSSIRLTPCNLPWLSPPVAATVQVDLRSSSGRAWPGVEVGLQAAPCTATPARATTDGGGTATFAVACEVPRLVLLSARAYFGGLGVGVPARAPLHVYAPADATGAVLPGTRLNLQAVARGPDGLGPDPTYRGEVHFTSTDPLAELPEPTALGAADAGVRHWTGGLVLKTLGPQRVEARGQPEDRPLGLLEVRVARAEAALAWLEPPSEVTAGEPFDLRFEGRRPEGGLDGAFAHQAVLRAPDLTASLPPLIAFRPADGGTLSLPRAARLCQAGAQELTLTDLQTGRQSRAPIRVRPAAAARLELAVAGAAQIGQPLDLQITVRDAFGNLQPEFVGPLQLQASDPGAILRADLRLSAADRGRATFLGAAILRGLAGSLGQLRATATEVAGLEGLVWVGVAPAPTSRLGLGLPARAPAGQPQPAALVALDAWGNPTPSYRGTVLMGAQNAATRLPGPLTLGAEEGGALVVADAVCLAQEGSEVVRAVDAADARLQAAATVIGDEGRLAQVQVRASGAPRAGLATALVLRATAAGGSLTPSFTGPVDLACDDPLATLSPARPILTGASQGQQFLPGAFTPRRAGTTRLTATAASPDGPLASTTVLQVAADAPLQLTLLDPPARAVVGQPLSLQVGVLDAYGNLCAGASGRVRLTSSLPGTALPGEVDLAASAEGRQALVGAVTYTTVGDEVLGVEAVAAGWSPASTSLRVDHGCARLGDGPVADHVDRLAPAWRLALAGGRAPVVLLASRRGRPGAAPLMGFEVAAWEVGGWAQQAVAPRAAGDAAALAVDGQGRAWAATAGVAGLGLARLEAGTWRAQAEEPAGPEGPPGSPALALDALDRPLLAAPRGGRWGQDLALWGLSGGRLVPAGGRAALGLAGSARAPALAWAADGAAVLAFAYLGGRGEAEGLWVARAAAPLADGVWRGLGGEEPAAPAGPTPGGVAELAVGLQADGTPLVAWRDAGPTPQVFVRRWGAGAWSGLAGSDLGGGISQLPGGVAALALAIDGQDRPAVAYVAQDSGALYLQRFDGVQWAEVHGSASGGGVDRAEAGPLGLAIDADDRPVMLYAHGGLQVCRWQ